MVFEGISGGHPVQPPLLKQDHLKPRTMSRKLLNISRDGDSTTSLCNLCQCLVTLTVTKCFLMFRGNLLCFSLCPLPFYLSLGTTGKSLAPSSCHSLFRYLHTLIRFPLSLLFARLNSPNSLNLCYLRALHWTLSSMLLRVQLG